MGTVNHTNAVDCLMQISHSVDLVLKLADNYSQLTIDCCFCIFCEIHANTIHLFSYHFVHLLRMDLCSPSYFLVSAGSPWGQLVPDCTSSGTFHNLLILMSVKQAGEMPLPSELFTEEQLCSISHLHMNTSLLAVSMLNEYECLLEFASNGIVATIA